MPAWFAGLSLGAKSTVTLLLLAVIAVAAAVCMRSCNKIIHPKPPRPDRIESHEVVSVQNGNAIEVRARGKRTFTITLAGIGVPDSIQAESRSNLEQLAGATIRCVEPRRLLRGALDEGDGAMVYHMTEARKDFTTPQAWGQSGLCLQEEQLRAGMAISVGDIPKAWKAAEKEAQENKRGIWK